MQITVGLAIEDRGSLDKWQRLMGAVARRSMCIDKVQIPGLPNYVVSCDKTKSISPRNS